ncbi:hypothetical protein DIPPA_07898 [Diplonema papillatum]|nr:hypothetical protein DIPPA_07898 [Diplonema papillatum]
MPAHVAFGNGRVSTCISYTTTSPADVGVYDLHSQVSSFTHSTSFVSVHGIFEHVGVGVNDHKHPAESCKQVLSVSCTHGSTVQIAGFVTAKSVDGAWHTHIQSPRLVEFMFGSMHLCEQSSEPVWQSITHLYAFVVHSSTKQSAGFIVACTFEGFGHLQTQSPKLRHSGFVSKQL